jgi:guanyl-specific ribonuclease Sa
VLDLAALTAESARVLCSDGLVRSTTSHGTVWTNVAAVDGALAIAVPTTDPTQTYVARANAPGCQGIQIRSVQSQARQSCAQVAIPDAAGRVALSLVRGGGWLAVGDRTMRSTDNLLSWQAS